MNETSYPDKWKILIAVQLAIFMCTFEISVVNLALPVIQDVFDAPLTRVKWVAVLYSATVALCLPVTAYLGRRYGTVRVYRLGQLFFSIATVSCGFARSLEVLLLLRMVSGFGAAFLLSLNRVVVLGSFPGSQHGMALGVSGSTFALGIVSGLAAGGLLIETLGWQSVFFVNLLAAIPMLLLSWRALRSRTLGIEQERIAFDAKGCLLTVAGLGLIVYAVTHLLELLTSPDLESLLIIAASLLLVPLWLRHEFRAGDSFLNLHIIKTYPLPYNFLNTLVVRFSIGALNFIVPFYLQTCLALSPFRASVVLCSGAVATGICGPLAGRWIDRIGPMMLLRIGLVLIFLGCICYTLLPSGSAAQADTGAAIALVVLAQIFIGTGSVCFSGAFLFSSMRGVSRQSWASISSLQSVVMMAGSAIGASVAADLVGTWASGTELDQGISFTGFFLLFLLLGGMVGGLALYAFIYKRKPYDAASASSREGVCEHG
ncbi:MFS transporter [Desulfogranum mediterraneum]|uniref:MFS transporter n=1 Tax=Desulfogranum mediterraneum TaxID=160661 RepID=UPI000403F8A7|nr:MFS transporter [Desulfogranum mediterraneum]